MKINNLRLLIPLILFFTSISLTGQVVVGKSKASDFTDAEILQLIQKAESAGLSEAQVVELARARGVSDSEMELFKQRVQHLKNNSKPAVSNETNNSVAEKTSPEKPKTQEPIVPKGLNVSKSRAGELIATSWEISKIFDEQRFPAFANGRTIKAPDQYVIGVGDEISITVFGNSYFNKVSRVDDRGRIDLGTALGKIYVKGLAFGQLEKVIRAAVGQKINLSGNELEVDLSFSRQISVNVSGEIQKPGTYQLPAANTVFNLLVLSGGPTANGSVRNIEVVKSGKVAFRFDLYDYLINPSSNIFLEDGDFIVVKPAVKRIVLGGGVLRAGQIELTESEKLEDAIKYAGGFSTKADPSRITISTLNGTGRSLVQLNFDQSVNNKNYKLKDGDNVFVFEQGEEIKNQVQVSGEVYFPGTYELTDGLTVKQMVELSGGLTPQSNLEMAFVIRTLENGNSEYMRIGLSESEMSGFKLLNKDQIVIFAKSRFEDEFKVEVRGEVRNPVRIDYKKGLTLNVLLDYAGGLKFSADATEVEILRSAVYKDDFKAGDRNKSESIRVTYNPSLKNGFEDLTLMAEDIVVVRKVSNLNDRIGVTIEGEIMHPGPFVLAKNENRVNDLIEKSGGFTEFAFLEAATLIRNGGNQLVFDLKSVMKNKNSIYNYRLEDGDRLVVPLKQDLVILPNTDTLLNVGKIYAPYISGKRAAYYLNNYSLGFDERHRKHLLYLKEPGGKIKRSKNYGLFVVTPKVNAGSEIFFQPAPMKAKKSESGEKKETDWNRVIENFTVKLTGIATLWVLLSRL